MTIPAFGRVRYRQNLLRPHGTWPTRSWQPLLAEAIGGRRTIIITTTSVDRLYGESLRSYIEWHAIPAAIHVVNCTEATKTLQTAGDICEVAQSLSIAVGCSLRLAAASARHRNGRRLVDLRGIGHVRIPTTLVVRWMLPSE